MTDKHTPGPWEAPGTDGDAYVICHKDKCGKRRTLAHVYAMKNGAFDFLEKPFEDNALVDVVIRALETDARRQASQETQATVASRLVQLTPREQEVMQLVLAGKFNKVIADELNISMRTVEVHRSRVFEKMGVRSAVELAQLLAQPRD